MDTRSAFLTEVESYLAYGLYKTPKYAYIQIVLDRKGIGAVYNLQRLAVEDLPKLEEEAAQVLGLSCLTMVTVTSFKEKDYDDDFCYSELEAALEKRGYAGILVWNNANTGNLLTLWAKVLEGVKPVETPNLSKQLPLIVNYNKEPVALSSIYPLCCGLRWVSSWLHKEGASNSNIRRVMIVGDVNAVMFALEEGEYNHDRKPALSYSVGEKQYNLYALSNQSIVNK